MPEQLTKYPEVTLQVLRSAGASCGKGASKTILTGCPTERFCKLPGGELCVYGLGEAATMTQITSAEWKALSVFKSPEPAPPAQPNVGPGWLSGGAGVLLGVVIGLVIPRLRRPHQ